MGKRVTSYIGEVDRSGTWADGLVVGSPEWTEAMIRMEVVGGLMESGTPPELLMGVFDAVEERES